MFRSAPSFFGLPSSDHPQLLAILSERRKGLYRELFELTYFGKVGSFWDARKLPTELRRFWIERVIEARKAENGTGDAGH